MDPETLLDAMKTIESEIVCKGGDHLDITQDREFSNGGIDKIIVDIITYTILIGM